MIDIDNLSVTIALIGLAIVISLVNIAWQISRLVP